MPPTVGYPPAKEGMEDEEGFFTCAVSVQHKVGISLLFFNLSLGFTSLYNSFFFSTWASTILWYFSDGFSINISRFHLYLLSFIFSLQFVGKLSSAVRSRKDGGIHILCELRHLFLWHSWINYHWSFMMVIYHTISYRPTVTTQSSASIFYKFYKFAHPNPLFCLVFKTKEGSLRL